MPLCNLSVRQDLFNLNEDNLCSIFFSLAGIEVIDLLWDKLELLTYSPKFKFGLSFVFFSKMMSDMAIKMKLWCFYHILLAKLKNHTMNFALGNH